MDDFGKIIQKINASKSDLDIYFDCDTMRKNKNTVVVTKKDYFINHKYRFLTKDKVLFDKLSNYFEHNVVDFNSLNPNLTLGTPIVTNPNPFGNPVVNPPNLFTNPFTNPPVNTPNPFGNSIVNPPNPFSNPVNTPTPTPFAPPVVNTPNPFTTHVNTPTPFAPPVVNTPPNNFVITTPAKITIEQNNPGIISYFGGFVNGITGVKIFSEPSPQTVITVVPSVIPPPNFTPTFQDPTMKPNSTNNIPPGSPKKTPKNKKLPIPIDVRNKVWRNWCGGKMDGKCFCCDINISYEKWECGHIHSEAHGGLITEANLRPICKHCNKTMSAQHMYLYMFLNNLNGIKNLDLKDPNVINRKKEAESINIANQKIDKMVKVGDVKKTEGNKLKKEINNRKAKTEARLIKINEINKT